MGIVSFSPFPCYLITGGARRDNDAARSEFAVEGRIRLYPLDGKKNLSEKKTDRAKRLARFKLYGVFFGTNKYLWEKIYILFSFFW